jgi:hypothetical protein
MIRTLKFALGAALLATSHFASADLAFVTISDLKLSVSGGEWWYWLPSNVNWLPPTAATSAAMLNPGMSDGATGWHGNTLSSAVQDGTSGAKADISALNANNLNGVTASASVTANDGQEGWAFANVFDGQIMVGGNATISVSFNLDNIQASGTMAQANAYIDICSTDFVNDVCDPVNAVEAFVDANSPAYSGSTLLTASWTNPGATTWAKMHIGLTASAASVAPVNTPVPEPTSAALCMAAGMGLVGTRARRRKA